MAAIPTITRREFVTRFMRDAGLSYLNACRVYDTMVRVVEDGVVSGSKVSFGQVGSIVPVWRKPRELTKHFERRPGNVIVRSKRTYVLDGRYVYKFNVYKKFKDTHRLNWHVDLGPFEDGGSGEDK